MLIELVQAVLRVASTSSSNWTVWWAYWLLLVVGGVLALWKEWARRRTYREILSGIRPGTMLVDTTRRGQRLVAVQLPTSPAARPITFPHVVTSTWTDRWTDR